MNSSVLAEVRGLRFQYPDGAQALDGVDFTLREGETVALLGPNGSGKTTFLHLLVGLLAGDGLVAVCGRETTGDPAFAQPYATGWVVLRDRSWEEPEPFPMDQNGRYKNSIRGWAWSDDGQKYRIRALADYEASADGVTADDVISKLLTLVAVG